MPKKTQPSRSNINFRETKSERSATQSYKNFGNAIRKSVRRMTFGGGK